MTSFNLSVYIDLLGRNGLIKSISNFSADTKIIKLTSDTRELDKSPALFVCKGAHFKDEYLAKAEMNGAVAAIGERYIECSIPFIEVTDVRAAMSDCAKLHADGCDEGIYKIGITGTKGKSTVAYFVRSILNCALRAEGKNDCAILSSINNYDGIINEESHLTTPEPIELFAHFENASASGITHLVMEASSQGLKYGRLRNVEFDIGVFLNIGEDHISGIEHKDFDDYFNSKLKILDISSIALANRDIPQFDIIKEYANNKTRLYSFGRSDDADFRLSNVSNNGTSYDFDVTFGGKTDSFRITMTGDFNVDNALAAIAICTLASIEPKYIRAGLLSARASGRMERFISADGKVEVVVDYAHNKLSFEALFSSLEAQKMGRSIVAVYGCPGNKAQIRRRDLSVVAGQYCDKIYITEEDSGEESFESISSDIRNFIPECTQSLVIENRGKAIEDAIYSVGNNGTLVAITGKGRETRQKRGLAYIDCPSDTEYTKKALTEYNEKIDLKDKIGNFAAFNGKKVVIGIFGSVALGAKKLNSYAETIALYKAAGANVKIYTSSKEKVSAALFLYGSECVIVQSKEKDALDLISSDAADKVVIIHCKGALALGENRSETSVGSLSFDDLSAYCKDEVFSGMDAVFAKGAYKIMQNGCERVAFLSPHSSKALLFEALLPYPDGTIIKR